MLAKSTNGDAQYDPVYEYKSDLDVNMEIETLDGNGLDTVEEIGIEPKKEEKEEELVSVLKATTSPQPPPPPPPPPTAAATTEVMTTLLPTSLAPKAADDGSHYPSATSDAMATYQNITNNIYLGSANGKSLAEESMPCECKFEPGDDLEAACGDDDMCINRMMFMECMVDDCPCDRYCRNRRFQLRQYARVDVIRTEKKGFGLRALTDLPRNAFIMEYIGEVITNTEFIRRTRAYEVEGLKHYYFMTLKTDEIIDATKKGCLARFINHSCNPNSVTQKWVVGKTMRIGIFTKRPVKAGTELTFDYKFERYGAVAQRCFCGEPNCKGYIGGANKGQDEEEEEDEEQEVYTPNDLSLNDFTLATETIEKNNSKMDDDDDDEIKDAVTLTQKRMLGKLHRRRESEPLHQPDEVKRFVQRMLDSKGKPKLVNRLLRTLELTNSSSSLGKDALRRFVHLHGLKMLKCWLTEWKTDEGIVEKVLIVLEHLPLANRNGLEDCKMFDVVGKYTTHDNDRIKHLSESILSNWKELKSVYRIPKRTYVEPKENGQDSKRRDHPMDEDSSLLPALKRPPYMSTRDYIDRDDDYYEYLTYNADMEEIRWKMEFLPNPAIPTAPRAMLESSHAYGLSSRYMMSEYDPSFMTNDDGDQETANPAPASVFSEDIPTGPSGSYYDMYAMAAASAAAAAAAASTGPSSSGSLAQPSYGGDSAHSSTSATQAYQPSIYNTPRENGDISETQPYPVRNNTTGATLGDTVGHTPPSSSGTVVASVPPKLPHNWLQATTEDGNVYYYHKLTNKTQWSFPEEKISSIEGVDPARLEDAVNQAILRKSHSPSVDGSPSSSSQYHQQLSSSSASTTPTSKYDSQHAHSHHNQYHHSVSNSGSSHIVLPSSSSSSSPSSHLQQQYVSTSRRRGSTDSGHHQHHHHPHSHRSQSNDIVSGMDEVELKQEVGKVVTRHLNGAAHKDLWNGDKHLFKELARRLTHHIVERETQSNRKIHTMKSALRSKIEKFIDSHATAFAAKIKSKKEQQRSSGVV